MQANFGDSASNSFPDILFPSTNSTFQLVFSGVADKTYVAQPSAVVTERGTFLVAARVGATHQGDAGDIYLLECALDGTMLATNMVYHDADGFDARNAVLFKTSQNTLLLAFDLFEYIHSTWPTNSLRMMRSTDWGAHWISTNTLPCIGTNCSTAGEMVQCTDGRIILPYFQLVTNAPQWTAWAQTSTNDGISWGSDRMLADLTGADVSADEPSLTWLGGSNVLCSIRGDGSSTSNWTMRSFDSGVTWTAPTNQWLCRSKINTVMTSNGLLLATYRQNPKASVAYRVSADTGTTWSAERIIDSRFISMQYSTAQEFYPGVLGLFYGYAQTSTSNAALYLRYGTVVTNAAATNALLTARGINFFVGATNGVILDLQSQGTEHEVAFSLNFDPALLKFVRLQTNNGVGSASLLLQTNQIASGRIGVTFTQPAGQSFSAGWTPLATVYFAGLTGATATVHFADAPVVRSIRNVTSNLVSAAYADGTITIQTLTATVSTLANPSYGGDVAGGGTYAVGSTILLTATASNNWQFVGWNTGLTNNPYTVTVPATNILVTANFIKVDSIGDGIPDWWRAQYFGGDGSSTNASSCATSDPDHDGQNNRQEYAAATNPTNASSRIVMLDLAIRNNDVFVRWTGGSDAWQTLQCNSALNATNDWFDLLTIAPPTPLTNTFQHIGAGAATNLFYRVKAWR